MNIIAYLALTGMVALSAGAETTSRQDPTPGAPTLVIEASRLKRVVLLLGKREKIELLLGEGIDTGGATKYVLRLPEELPLKRQPIVEGVRIVYKDDLLLEVSCFVTGIAEAPWTSYKGLATEPNQPVDSTAAPVTPPAEQKPRPGRP
ncbi:hypothetical protein FEM03_00290 [Phragmitibacter flavus]|uniref:Uncharacterized protein n=1 Tax=Phragmitibacter flavus TaxID=2576071 RepID=A0A5R8KLG1_9BACT|nr:hypothetical protein [Phragmitibacter flavus]TLD72549.1 hypothetical protein FEM03_00290 [Phragmitibacter flavus]